MAQPMSTPARDAEADARVRAQFATEYEKLFARATVFLFQLPEETRPPSGVSCAIAPPPDWFDTSSGQWQECPCIYSGCKGTAGKYPWLCDAHGPDMYRVDVRASSLPGTSMQGLFARHDMEEGYQVIVYGGRPIYTGTLMPLGTSYVIQVDVTKLTGLTEAERSALHGLSFDGSGTQTALGRWLNDGSLSSPTVSNNCEFVHFTNEGKSSGATAVCVLIRTTRPVKKGEELLVSYGALFSAA